ncbi:MAG: DUF4331 family protein [Pirellulaceae bacterium]|nr:DUF4331 family protein [Planctomycetales bacterium]
MLFHARSLALFFASILISAATLRAADHLDAPALDGDGQVDVNDLYAFQSPSNPDNAVLIMTVNPFAGAISPTDFGTDVDYELQVDSNGDAMADITYRTRFSPSANGQDLFVWRDSETLGTGTVGTDIALAGGGMIRAGVFDDPFFFDLAGFRNGFAFTGEDSFAGANVSAIILEIPRSELGSSNVGVWARTTRSGIQQDRMGRPAINTALIPAARKNDFNVGEPKDDAANFGAEVMAAIEGLSNTQNAADLTPVLLPDILTFDTSSSSGFLNGRRLTDDVIDAELQLLSAGAVVGDGVDANDQAFSNAFPYLAPQNVPEPSGGLVVMGLAALTFYGHRRRPSATSSWV